MNINKYGKDFALIVVGQIVSLFGNAILRFALPLYLLRETGSSTLYGAVTACSFLPMIVLSLLGGVLADRVNKRNIMVGLDFLTALIITLFYLLIGKVPTVPLFAVTLMLLYGISGTYQPAVQASIPALVSKDNVLSASAIVNQIGSLANLIGPIIGGMLYGMWGMAFILRISIVCFSLSAIMEIFIVIPFRKRTTQDRAIHIVKNDIIDSMRFLKLERPVFLKVCFMIAALNLFLSSMITIGVPVIIVDYFSMSDQMLGITQGLLAIGGVFGGLLTVIFEKRLTLQKSHFFLLLCSLITLLLGCCMFLLDILFLKYVILSMGCMAITICSTMFSIQMLAVVQAETPQHLIGKVVACILTLTMCAQPIGQLLYGVIFEQIANSSTIIIAAGIISMLIAFYSKGVLKELQKSVQEGKRNGNE